MTSKPIREDSSKESFLQIFKSLPLLHQSFIAIVLLQCISTLIERIWLFTYADLSDKIHLRQALYFLLVVLVSLVFVAYFAIHSVLHTNSFEMFAFFFASTMLLIRIVMEYVNRSEECSHNHAKVCASFLGISIFFIVVAMGFTTSIFKDLRWKRYKALGAQPLTQRMYRLYELFTAVRKLDIQFSLICLITGLVFFSGDIYTAKRIAALTINVLLFAVELVWDLLGNYGIDKESFRALVGFWSLSFFLPLAIILLIVDTFVTNDLFILATSESLRVTILVMGILAIINRIATVATAVLLFTNFGPNYVGLRRIIEGNKRSRFLQAPGTHNQLPDIDSVRDIALVQVTTNDQTSSGIVQPNPLNSALNNPATIYDSVLAKHTESIMHPSRTAFATNVQEFLVHDAISVSTNAPGRQNVPETVLSLMQSENSKRHFQTHPFGHPDTSR